MSEDLDDNLSRNAMPTFSVVYPDATDMEWCFRKFRLSADIGIGPELDSKIGLMAYLLIMDEKVSVLCLDLTAGQFNKAMWLAKSEDEDKAFEYLKSISSHVQ